MKWNVISIIYRIQFFFFSVILKRVNDFSENININSNFQGFTALHYAALFNNIETIKVLIKYGADPHLKSVTGHKPIDLVTDLKVYNLLLEYQENVSNILILNNV